MKTKPLLHIIIQFKKLTFLKFNFFRVKHFCFFLMISLHYNWHKNDTPINLLQLFRKKCLQVFSIKKHITFQHFEWIGKYYFLRKYFITMCTKYGIIFCSFYKMLLGNMFRFSDILLKKDYVCYIIKPICFTAKISTFRLYKKRFSKKASIMQKAINKRIITSPECWC